MKWWRKLAHGVVQTHPEEENSNLEAKQPPNEPTQSTDDQRERLPMKAMQMRGLVGTILANITVEPYIFLYSLGFGMTTIITPILYMNKICSVRIIVKFSYKRAF